jgi:hypothetical protein
MKIALQYANKRDGCTMALFSKPKRKFRAHTLPTRNSWTQRASQRLARGFACASAVLLLYTPGQSRSRNATSILEIT